MRLRMESGLNKYKSNTFSEVMDVFNHEEEMQKIESLCGAAPYEYIELQPGIANQK